MNGVGSGSNAGREVGCVALRGDRPFTTAGRAAAEVILSVAWARAAGAGADARDATDAMTNRTVSDATRRMIHDHSREIPGPRALACGTFLP